MKLKELDWKHRLSELLDEEAILFDGISVQRYKNNASALTREILGVLKPKNTLEVKKIVDWANQEKICLYPISQGKNWGLGSRLPVRDRAVIIDLSGMDQILEINHELGYAIVEPGVTQQQLYATLKKLNLPFLFNVTGSGKDTSLLGNALDRGVGYLTTRAEDILNLEVVLGNGDVIQTGYGHYPAAKSKHVYSYGIGPDLQGLFMQSNFGIVTRATFRLIPESVASAALVCRLSNPAEFGSFIDALSELRQKGIIRTAFHIGNRERLRSTMVPQLQEILVRQRNLSPERALPLAEQAFYREMPQAWSAFGRIAGTPAMLKVTFKEVKRALSKYGKVSLINQKKLNRARFLSKHFTFINRVSLKQPFLTSFSEIYGLTQGIPTDMPIKSLAYRYGLTEGEYQDLDQTHFGILFVTPLLPLSGKAAVEVQEITKKIFDQYRFEAFVTLNMCNEKSLEGVINVLFDKRDDAQIKKAHLCMDQLTSKLVETGYIPYRVGIQAMHHVVSKEDSFWKTVAALKHHLDPNQIIAPGRYNLY